MLKKLSLLPFFSFLLGRNVLKPPPNLAWDHNPEAIIIRTTSGGGKEPMAAVYNRIPDAVVWGDGRIVWQTFDENSQRQVWQGQLSEEKMTSLLQTFADKGFWQLKQHYEPRDEIFDGSSTSLRINLLEDSTGVSEYHNGAPKAFHELVGLLNLGAGIAGQPYVPQSGYLSLRPLGPHDGDVAVWDAAAAQISLNDLDDGWVEGAALQQSWEIINKSYWSSVVMDDGKYYEIYLQLPELTGRKPN